MTQTAKIFMNGRSQAVRLPAAFRFSGREVFIERQGDAVIIRPKPLGWDDFLSVKAHFEQVGTIYLCISTVVLAELYYGAARHPKGPAIWKEIGEFVSRLAVIPWDETAADHYGQIRAALEKADTPIGAMDMMIAAHARSQGATLVSNNIRHFDKVPRLLKSQIK